MSQLSGAPFVLIPTRMGEAFRNWGASWGWLDVKWADSEDVVVVAGFSDSERVLVPYSGLFDRGHFTSAIDTTSRSGVWYRVEPELSYYHRSALVRDLSLDVDALRERVKGWRVPPKGSQMLVVTFSDTDDGASWSAWWIDSETAFPAAFDVIQDVTDAISFLAPAWPVDEFRGIHATVVGVGSIGSTAAESLAAAGVGNLLLFDHDRLLQHNIPRHRLSEYHIGRNKVKAMKEVLIERHPGLEIEAFVGDVATDADRIRPLFATTDVIVCATDGVESRRVANHLARRAGTPIVFSAVLEDGAFGEIVRVTPRTGCLWCLRRTLLEDGTLNPEPALDLEYGTGSPHRPMTAAPSDLRFVGELAAKSVISMLLEARGRWSQRLPGDWALVGLQPTPDMPPPFDIEAASDLRWLDLPDVRDDCPTCAAP